MFAMIVTLCGSHELDVPQKVETHIPFPRTEVMWCLFICVDETFVSALTEMMTQNGEH